MITKEPCCEGGTCYRLILEQEGRDDCVSVNPVGDGKGKPRRIDCDTCYTCIRVFDEEVSDEHIFNEAYAHIKTHIIVPSENSSERV